MSILDDVLEQTPAHYQRFVRLVGTNDPIVFMEDQPEYIDELLSNTETSEFSKSYESGKWTIKEVLGHLVDVERIFGYRAYRLSRFDETVLAGFEQDELVAKGNWNDRAMDSILEEFYHLRQANLSFIKDLTEEQLDFRLKPIDKNMSLRAYTFFLGGHAQHHLNVIESKYI